MPVCVIVETFKILHLYWLENAEQFSPILVIVSAVCVNIGLKISVQTHNKRLCNWGFTESSCKISQTHFGDNVNNS